MEKLLLAELARQVGLTETTARRYIKTFAEYFNPEKDGQRALYTSDDGHILKQIAALYAQGMTTEQVKSKLSEDHTATIEAVTEVTPPLSERAIAAQERLAGALEEMANQRDSIAKIQQVDKQHDAQIQALQQEVGNLRRQLQQTSTEKMEEMDIRVERLELSQLEPKRPWWRKIFRKTTVKKCRS